MSAENLWVELTGGCGGQVKNLILAGCSKILRASIENRFPCRRNNDRYEVQGSECFYNSARAAAAGLTSSGRLGSLNRLTLREMEGKRHHALNSNPIDKPVGGSRLYEH